MRHVQRREWELSNEPIPWNCVLLEKSPILQLFNSFPTIYRTRRFIIVFTRTLYWSLSRTRTNPVHRNPSYLRYILILSSYLRLDLHIRIFPSGSPIKTRACCIPCQYHPAWLDHSDHNLKKSTSYEAPHYAVFSNLLSLHPSLVQIFSSTPCSHPLCSSLNVKRPSFTPTQNHRQNYTLLGSNFYVFRQQTRGENVMNWMAASITGVQSPLILQGSRTADKTFRKIVHAEKHHIIYQYKFRGI
jgi:hypothetical protein